MSYSATIPYSGSSTCYAKPVTPGSPPSSTPSWATDIVSSSGLVTGALTFASLADSTSYWVYEQAGGSPASSDILLGIIEPSVVSAINSDATQITLQSNVAIAAEEVVKIPRASSSKTAGAQFTRTKVSSGSSFLTESLD